jgi:hypothetical protein
MPERPLKKDMDARHKAGHDGRAVPKPGRLAAAGVSQVQRNLIANLAGLKVQSRHFPGAAYHLVVMAGLVPAIHVFAVTQRRRRGCPAQGRA